MKYYFVSIENQERLKRVLDSWLIPSTPFRHHCGVKGKGCDCIHFVARVFEELAILQWRKDLIPDYPRDWHLHRTQELLMQGILKELSVERVEISDLMNGDLVLFQYGRASAHAAIYYDRNLYQSITGVGVRKIAISEQEFRKRMTFAFRVLA